MVVGIDRFREFFADFNDCYVIIGGTATSLVLSEVGLTPRATKDIDLILIIESLTPEFGRKFWEFIEAGQYTQRERSPEKREYFRFMRPAVADFPIQIEIFSRRPDALILPEGARLSPLPLTEGITSLSAVLMDDDYYAYTIENGEVQDGIHRATIFALILLKAKAYLNLIQLQQTGAHVDARDIRKHKGDVFRLAVLLTDEQRGNLPPSLAKDLTDFLDKMRDDQPGKDMFKDLGAGNVEPTEVLERLFNSFGLKQSTG